jgi:hypothetical protein
MKPRFKSFALVLALGVALGSVHPVALAAKWELVAQSNNGFYYLDPRSVETSADRKTAWTVLDHRELQSLRDGKRYRSSHAQVQFNCKANLARIMHLSYYSGAMLAGSQVHQQGMLQDWFELEAGSPMKRVAAKVC